MSSRDVLILLIVVLVASHFLHNSFYITGPIALVLLVLLVLALAGRL